MSDALLDAMRSMWGDRWWQQAKKFMLSRDTVRDAWMAKHSHDPRSATPREIAEVLSDLGWTVEKFRRANY